MKYRINLISKKSTGFFDRVLYFFLNYLRYILVITQLVVIGVLFFRFRIDQNIIDLKDSIDQKKEIVEVVKPILAETQKLKTREDVLKEILSQQRSFSDSLNYVLSAFPETIKLNRFNVDENGISMDGVASNPQHLQSFYKRLRDEKKFKTVTLSEITRNEFGFAFNLTLSQFNNQDGKVAVN